MTQQELIELRERNTQRVAEAIQRMGAAHLLHPDNQVQRLTKKPVRFKRSQEKLFEPVYR